jgi:leader peptidase (prepilin peptidase)/N-methyltransferase
MTTGLLIALWAALGMAVGSFLNLVADRLPQGGSLLSPPSHCAACGHRLGVGELVPVWSYLALRGRCRGCGAPIGVRTLGVELVAGLLFALAAWRATPADLEEWGALLFSSVYLAVLLLVTVTDLEHRLILNRVIVPAIGLGLIGALLAGCLRPTGRSCSDLLTYLGGGLLGTGVIVLIIALVPEGMGWGDARLAGFVGLVTGLQGVQFALFVAFVSGGLVAGALLVSGRCKRGDTIPLGPFLAFGGGAVLLYGEEMVRAFHTLAALVKI